MEIRDERMHALVQMRQVILHHFEVIAMPVPEAVGNVNKARARFNQPPGCEELLVQHRGCIPLNRGNPLAVAGTNLGIFLVEVHRVDELTRCQNVIRFLREAIETFEGVNFAAVGI